MNYRMIKYTLGWLMMFEAAFFLLPLATAIIYGEWKSLFAFLISAGICLAIGGLCILKKPEASLPAFCAFYLTLGNEHGTILSN